MSDKVHSGAEHDYGITIQAKAIFQLAYQHIKKALHTELTNKGYYKPYPTYYIDCRDKGDLSYIRGVQLNATMLSYVRGTQIVFASTADFLKETSYEEFVVGFCFYDPDKDTRPNSWNGFFIQNSFSNRPGILLFCPYDPPKRDSYGFIPAGKLAEAFKSSINGYNSQLKSIFVHEFGHNYNFLQWKDKAKQINRIKGPGSKAPVPKVKYKSPPSTGYSTPEELAKYEAYVNDPQEVNARYLEWIHAIQVSFNRLLRIRDAEFDIRKAFPTFHDFWEFYWAQDGFVPEALHKWANDKTKRKLARRLAGFYQFLVKEPASNPAEVENFVRDQMKKDSPSVDSHMNKEDYLA